MHEIYAYGLRNPFRFSFDAPTDRLIVGDVGQNNIEEVDFVEAGKNYGWNRKEGSFLFDPNDGSIMPDPSPDPALTDPVLEYSHEDGSAVIGGFIERGTACPRSAANISSAISSRRTPAPAACSIPISPAVLIQELRIGDPERNLGILLKGFGQDDNGDVYASATTTATASSTKLFRSRPSHDSESLDAIECRDGDNVLIGGFIVTGSDDEEVVLRGIGPSLPVAGSVAQSHARTARQHRRLDRLQR